MEQLVLTAHAGETVTTARQLAYAVVAVGSAVLLYYLYAYARDVYVAPDSRSWVLLGVGIGAGVVYGVAGAVQTVVGDAWLATFVEGATLFFLLFVALGIRELYVVGTADARSPKALPDWVDYAVIAGFVGSWWASFLVSTDLTRLVVVVGWVGASLWALYYSVLVVRHQEGTSIAALVRNLMPALVAVTAVVFADVTASYAGGAAAVEALWLVGTVLVGSFLFTTAVAIRQQGGQVERMYDWTTWRGESLEEDTAGRAPGGHGDD
ncbi:MAG: hypothetical protein ACI8XM_002877 [Haloarculaceae archaeon]|jgi:hypothetical protein